MGWLERFDPTRLIHQAALRKTPKLDQKTSESGIALFMVLGAITMLTLLITDFAYVTQVNSRIAYDGLDQLKAYYTAKSAFKLSLLRLKAFQHVQGIIEQMSGAASGAAGGGPGAAAAVSSMMPKAAIDKLWSFPLIFPIPTMIPGLTVMQKDQIEKFQKESQLSGSFSSLIESESGKMNLNLILAQFIPLDPKKPGNSVRPSPTPSPSESPTPGVSPSPSPSPSFSFNPEDARKNLADYMVELYNSKAKEDEAFSTIYRDLRFEDLMAEIFEWADPTYEPPRGKSTHTIPPKKAPFYSVSELRLLPSMDDTLYDLFAPNLTASTTPGINVNTMTEPVFRALFPLASPEEVKEFFKFRDSTEADNLFKNSDAFFEYLKKSLAAFSDDKAIEELRSGLKKRGIRIVTDEKDFKITVQAQVGKSTKTIEAWVTLIDDNQMTDTPRARPSGEESDDKNSQNQVPKEPGIGQNPGQSESGLRVVFMRIL